MWSYTALVFLNKYCLLPWSKFSLQLHQLCLRKKTKIKTGKEVQKNREKIEVLLTAFFIKESVAAFHFSNTNRKPFVCSNSNDNSLFYCVDTDILSVWREALVFFSTFPMTHQTFFLQLLCLHYVLKNGEQFRIQLAPNDMNPCFFVSVASSRIQFLSGWQRLRYVVREVVLLI